MIDYNEIQKEFESMYAINTTTGERIDNITPAEVPILHYTDPPYGVITVNNKRINVYYT